MYRYSDGQISLTDFEQPMGMKLREDNRWVKKAQIIPWGRIEDRYAALFPSNTGNVAKPLRLALGALLIQQEYGYSDEEIVLQIQENPYLQYFCGYSGFDDSKPPFDSSSMVHFRKRITPEILGEINEMIIQEAQPEDDNDNDNDENGGTMIVDATCAPSQIRYPQDVSLLNEARENAEKLVDLLHDPADGKKPRTYRKRARKDYLKYARSRKHTAKMTRKAIGKQLGYLRRNLSYINAMLAQGKTLKVRQMQRLETIRNIYEQQKYMYDNRTHTVPDRIVSVSQPFVRPIVRGKAGKPVEFGMKLDISVVDGWTRLEYHSFDAYNEATKLQEMIEAFRVREGHYPSRVLADKIYRNRENLRYCKEHGIRLSGPALGRPRKGEVQNKAQDYKDECERVEVERRFSLSKRKCGMGLVTARLQETAEHVIAMSILVLNLRRAVAALLRLFYWFVNLVWYCNNQTENRYLFSRHYLSKLFAPYFAEGSSIINISSSRDRMSQPQSESYTAAKGGISALTHALAVSLAGKVRVNSISPGWIDNAYAVYEGPDAIQQPAGRVGKPLDIANMVLFLASDKAGFITGENICVDGGQTRLMIYHGDHGWTLTP